MEVLLQVILLIIIVIILVDDKWGIALFIAYSFLVPYCKLGFGGFVLRQNLINTIILLSTWAKCKKLDLKPFYAFIIFYGLILLTIPLTDGVDFDFKIDRWRVSIMLNTFIPIALWNIHSNKNAYSLIRSFLISTILISCIYGIYLTTMGGVNPYAMFFYSINGNEYRFEWFSSDTRLFGRISSVFVHPMSYGMFLGCSLIYVYHNREQIRKILFYLMVALIVTNIIICGVRSVLFASIVTFLFFLITCRNYKIVLGLFLFATLLIIIIYNVPKLYDYFFRMSDVTNQSDMGGSSLDMRLLQLKGCFIEIQDCFLFGKGHMWHEYYMTKYEIHPVILAFESLLFMIICDYGIFGFFIYGIMFFILLHTQNIYIKNKMNKNLLSCFIVFYLSYCILTGDYSYMKIFLIFYYLSFSEMYLLERKMSCS